MSLYQRLFAVLMAHADGRQHALYGDRKRALFAGLRGVVLEIGPGSGVNLAYYPESIRWIGVEPNVHMHRYIRQNAAEQGLEVELHAASAENLALAEASVDAAVSTLVLCSVPDVAAVLAEVRRVLKPGGRFYFIEHVAAPPGTLLRRVQQAVRPLWQRLADGCRPDQETGYLLRQAGFSDVQYDAFRLSPAHGPITPHIIGVARNAGVRS
jgi:ubiquinone/menaquinone biosynthesis C-methylase UbiE